MKSKFIDNLLYVLLFIFVAAFPVDLFQIPAVYKVVIQIALRVLLIGYYGYLIWKNKIKIFGVANITNILLCVPFFIACFSNMIASRIDGAIVGSSMTNDTLVAMIFLSLTVAVSEEILFRLFIHNSLVKGTSLTRILGSAGIFAAMHLINLANVSSVDALVTVLVQVVYDFGLGLMLGFLYEYSHSIVACVGLHFCFNVCNQDLVKYFGFESSTLCFYLTAVVIAIILVIYSLSIYKFYFKKFHRFYR